MSEKGASPTQLTLIFINLLFVVAGIASMAVGGWVLIYREEVRVLTLIDVATNDLGLLQNAAILLVTSGIVIFVLGFMGCRATFRDQKCYRVVYIGLVLLCCVITVVACVLAFVYRDQVEDKLLTHLEKKLKTEYQGFTSSKVDFSQALDYAQVDFGCCGVQSHKDYEEAMSWTVRNSAVVPPTCCVMSDKEAYLDDRFITLEDTSCVTVPTATNSYIEKPCYNELKDWMEEQVTIVGGIAIGTIVLQLLSVLFLVAIMKKQGKDTDYLHRSNLYNT
ncbi:tetraspanin-18B-like [Littorina saxatilis]|uniref:Tetraspanin n=1 Tax=Littorina saxatilis TaxID=31220 RepID=A0AAN9ARP5_9CAEN